MATNTPVTRDSVTPISTGAGASVQDQARSSGALALLMRQGQWLFVLIPYLFAWILPFAWSGIRWTSPSYCLFFQPFIILFTPFLVWSQRDRIVRVTSRSGSSSARKTGAQGNVLLFTLGILCLLFSYLVQIKGFACIGMLLVGWGVVQYIFGWRVFKAIWLPILFSLFSIPIPDSIADAAQRMANRIGFQLILPLFKLLHRPAEVSGTKLNFRTIGAAVDYNYTQSAIGMLLLVMVAVLYYAMIRRFDSVRATILLTFTVLVSVFLNVCRLLAAGMLVGNPHISELLGRNEFVIFVIGLVGLLVSLFIEQQCFAVFARMRKPKSRSRSESSGTLASGVETLGRAGETMAAPLEQGVRQVGTLLKRSEKGIEGAIRKTGSKFNPFAMLAVGWKRSERAIEAGLKKLFPRKKRRRRH